MTAPGPFWTVGRDEALRLRVRLTPNARSAGIDGVAEDGEVYLKVRVTAVPEKGKANRALIALLAKALGLPKGAFTIVAGETARMKVVEIAGGDAALGARLSLLAETGM